MANIRTIQPSREIATHSFKANGDDPVIVNKTHIAYEDEMINWHDGKRYRVKTIHPAVWRYELTPSSRVLTTSFWINGNGTLIDDPVNGKTEYLEHEIILSPDERHAVMWSGKRCRLLQWPERKETGTCGRLPLFFGTDRYRAVFAPDGKSFVSWIDGKARVYRTDPFRLTSEFALSRGKVDALELSNDGWLANVDEERRLLQLWDGATGKLAGQYQYQTSVAALAFQPHGDRLLVSESDSLKVFALPERATP
ncbi:MAG: WD40 repeat domain-containing protein [Azoarcus sp.]|nr:WD40 repeat domain-containing protein [Azoarcus sp.]